MASGRVGGTKALISGKVGDDVYSIVSDGARGYHQKVSQYVPQKRQTVTVKLACQQMCTAMVEAMMRDLRPVATIAYQSAVNKSKSINAFSSFNILKVQREMRDHWYEFHEFQFPTKGKRLKLGGSWITSSGTLQENSFSNFITDAFESDWIASRPRLAHSGLAVTFPVPGRGCTVRQFMEHNRLTYSTQVVVVCFFIDQDYDNEGFYTYNILSMNPAVRPQEIVTKEVLQSLFKSNANRYAYRQFFDPQTSPLAPRLEYATGCQTDSQHENHVCLYGSAFTISYPTGRKQITNSVMRFVNRNPETEIWADAIPELVVGSWMEPPTSEPIPNPF